jgi:hypothetical protein
MFSSPLHFFVGVWGTVYWMADLVLCSTACAIPQILLLLAVKIRSCTFAQTGLKPWFSYLCPPTSWDYRHVPPLLNSCPLHLSIFYYKTSVTQPEWSSVPFLNGNPPFLLLCRAPIIPYLKKCKMGSLDIGSFAIMKDPAQMTPWDRRTLLFWYCMRLGCSV